MTYLPTYKIRTITRVIIFFLLMGILPLANIFAHQGCQDTHKDEICPEHGVSERACSSCNPIMKGNTYEELLKKQCEHNISIIECDGCRYEVGAVKVDTSILGEVITIKEVESLDINASLIATGEVRPNRDRFVIL
ncbi:MAG: hypothetical protein HUU09_03855 [Candidatus Jettenia caeni]|nr:hypothetical protein [Candidatus Jettenia caeni]